jgi:hypothetical protein
MVDKYADLLPIYDNVCLEFIPSVSCAKISKDLVSLCVG